MGVLGFAFLSFLLWGGGGPARPILAAYFYHYMGVDHLDSLAAHGFNRAVIRWIPDSLEAVGARELSDLVSHGTALGLEVVPEWPLQNAARLASRPETRRYTWGRGTLERRVACPLDSLYWRSAMLDRAGEFLLAAPAVTRLALDLELYQGGRHHYDAGPCRCGWCLALYAAGHSAPVDARQLLGLLGFEEGRLERVLTGILADFHARWPAVELGVLDLDYDSFVHRALARALARAGVPTVDYCERSYGLAGGALPAARLRLDALGLRNAPLVGGLWLKRFSPRDLPTAARSVLANGQGYFVFTTYSLWLAPERLTGPYVLLGAPSEYWRVLDQVNRP